MKKFFLLFVFLLLSPGTAFALPIAQPITDLDVFEKELNIAGIPTNGIGSDGVSVYTYNASGNKIDLPPAAVQIIAAHKTPPVKPDLLAEAKAAKTFDDLQKILVEMLGG